MTKKNIQYCNLVGLGRMMALRAQRRRGFDGIVGSRASCGRQRRELGEDDDAAGLGTMRVDGVAGLGRTMLLRAQVRCCDLGDDACMVDGIIGSGQGRWQRVKGLNRGREQRRGGFGEDSTMTQRL
jgi:hypothetical protein